MDRVDVHEINVQKWRLSGLNVEYTGSSMNSLATVVLSFNSWDKSTTIDFIV